MISARKSYLGDNNEKEMFAQNSDGTKNCFSSKLLDFTYSHMLSQTFILVISLEEEEEKAKSSFMDKILG